MSFPRPAITSADLRRATFGTCHQAERRWVCTLLRDGATSPTSVPLPPLSEYVSAVRRRLESSMESDDGVMGEAPVHEANRAAAATQAQRTRGRAVESRQQSLWQNSVQIR